MDHNEQTHLLANESIGRLLWRYSIPAILGMVVNATYNVVDRIFVGQAINEYALTATTVCFPAMMFIGGVGMMIGIGSATLISIRLGEKQNEQAEKIVGQALLLFFIFSSVLTIVGLVCLEPLLYLFGATELSIGYAVEYLRIILLGLFFQMISFGVNSFIRAEGQPRIAMLTMFIAALLNTFFDWLFLFVFKTGIWGAAFATVLAQFITSFWILWLYLSGRTLIKIRVQNFRIDWKLALHVFHLGFPSFVMQSVA
ncbi:MAG: MATE family efflux transporter, partial [Thermoguttaceae bacterium]